MATLLRDYAKEQGLNVGYDPLTKNVTLGDKRLAPNQLEALGGQLVNGAWTFGDTTKLSTLTGGTTPTTTPTVTPTVTPATVAQPSFADQLARMKEQERINTLQQSLGKTLSGLETEKAGITPAMDLARGQARTRSTLSAQDLQNFLTQKGLGRSGAGVQGEIASNVALQGQLGGIDVEERRQLADIERRRQQAEQEFEFGKAQAGIAYDIEALQAAENERVRQAELARENQTIADAQAREDFQNTILANYADLKGFANRLQAQNAPQWQIDQVLAARQQKIAEQGLDQQGRPLPVDNTETIWNRAMDKWDAGIPLTQDEMRVLGTNQSVKPRVTSSGGGGASQSDMLSRWKALGSADPIVASYFNIPVGSVYGQVNFNAPTQTPTYSSPLPTREDFLANVANRNLTEKSDYVARLIVNGTFDALEQSNPELYNELNRIAENQGITQASLDQALARLGLSSTSQGVGNTQNIR